MKNPCYTFPEGVVFSDSMFGPGGNTTTTYHQSDPQVLAEWRQQCNDPTIMNPLLRDLRQSCVVGYKALDKTGRLADHRLEYSLLNDDADSRDIKVVTLGWSTDYRLPHAARKLAALAVARPDQRFMVLNPLGRGESSPLPLGTAWEMSQTGSYQPAGELAVRGLMASRVIAGEPVSLFGESEGGRLAVGMAAAGLSVEQLITNDSPALRPLGFWGLVQAMQRESTHGQRYQDASQDERALELCRQYRIAGLSAAERQRCFRNGGVAALAAQYVLQPWAMSRGQLPVDMAAALHNISGRLQCNIMEASEVTDSSYAAQVLAELSTWEAAHNKDIVLRRFPGMTHSYHSANTTGLAEVYTGGYAKNAVR